MTKKGRMRQLKLTNKVDAHIYDTGKVDLFNGEKMFTVKISDLAFLLQEFQTSFGGIPVTIDWLQFIGMKGE